MRRAVAVAAILLVALTGCKSIDQMVDEAMGGGVIHNDGNQTATDALQVGDCINDVVETGSDDDIADGITSIPVVECTKPHDSEVYKSFFFHGADFPGVDGLDTDADTNCRAAFEDYVGVAYDDSTLYYSWYVPTEAAWEAGSRDGLCILYEWDDAADNAIKITGALKGSGE